MRIHPDPHDELESVSTTALIDMAAGTLGIGSRVHRGEPLSSVVYLSDDEINSRAKLDVAHVSRLRAAFVLARRLYLEVENETITPIVTDRAIGHLPEHKLIDVIAGIDGAGARLLAGGNAAGIFRLGPVAIEERAGVDENAARRVACALELTERIQRGRAAKKPVLVTIGDGLEIIKRRARLATQEEAWILAIDPSERLIGVRCVAIGTAHRIPIDPSTVLRHAVELGAHGFLLAHFHIDGQQHPPVPSRRDLIFTAQVRQGGLDLSIALLDHLVVGTSGKVVSVLRALEQAEKRAKERKARAAKKARERRASAKKAKVRR